MYYNELSNLGIRLRRRSGQEKTACPQCSESRRNKKDPCLSVNITEGTYNCHHCGWKGNVKAFGRKETRKEFAKPSPDMLKNAELNEKIINYCKGRGLSEETLKKFFIHGKSEYMPQTQKNESCIVFPYLRGSEVVNAKYRDAKKNFRLVKDAELIFFGMHTLQGKRCAIITEGEFDCMAAYEAGFGQDYEPEANQDGEVVEHELGRWAVLSVPNGASRGSQQLEYLDNCSDWLVGIDEFIIATDNDVPGNELKKELIRRLGAEKCRVIDWTLLKSNVSPFLGDSKPCKDLNEVLVVFGKEAVKTLLNASNAIPIDGIYSVDDIFDQMITSFRAGVQLAPTTRFTKMDEYFRWKKGDINLFIGYANWGKTLFALQIMLTKSIWDGWKWAIFCPENYPANDFYDDIVEMYVGKWLNQMTEEEYTTACRFINEHIFYVYPDDDHDINSIHEKFKYLILKKGVDGVMIDPFNQLDKNQKAYERDDQYLSSALKDIKRFALVNHISYNIVTHPKNPSYQDGRQLPLCKVYDIAGGAMWANKCDQVISYHRPRFHEDPNSKEVEIHILKLKRKRTGGQLGSFELYLNWQQKRFVDPVSGEISCDPMYAARELKRKQNDYTQPKINMEENLDSSGTNNNFEQRNYFLPYKDDSGSEIGF